MPEPMSAYLHPAAPYGRAVVDDTPSEVQLLRTQLAATTEELHFLQKRYEELCRPYEELCKRNRELCERDKKVHELEDILKMSIEQIVQGLRENYDLTSPPEVLHKTQERYQQRVCTPAYLHAASLYQTLPVRGVVCFAPHPLAAQMQASRGRE